VAVKGSRQRYGVLLFVLGVTFFFYGVVEPGELQRAIGTVLVGATLLLALNAAEISSGLLRLATAVVTATVAGVIIASLAGTGTTAATISGIANALLVVVAPFFAFVYIAMENLGGAPFFANGAAAASPRAVYFSFITLTTVGYGDYTARTNFGHTLSISEALIGQIYLVTVVSAIVARLVPRGN
jgi:ion channel